MKIKAVVFDLDHTLFDRYATIRAISADFAKHFEGRLNVCADRIAKLLCDGDSAYIYYGWKRIFEYLCDMGAFSSPPAYEEYRETLLQLFSSKAVPFTFTYTVLEEVKKRGFKTGLITNGKAEIQEKKVKLLNLEGYFDEIILCGAFGKQKPDSAPFTEMAKRFDATPDTLIYVGDNPICDVGGAKNAGYMTVQVLTANCTVEGAPVGDYQIKAVDELPQLLDKILLL